MIVKTPGLLDADRVAFSDGVSEVLCTMAHQLVAMHPCRSLETGEVLAFDVAEVAPSDSGDEFIADLS